MTFILHHITNSLPKRHLFYKIADIKKVYESIDEMILRDTLVMIQCTNCGKQFNRSPSEIKLSKTGEYFCRWECVNEYRKLSGIKQCIGLVPKEQRIDMAVKSLEPGQEYSIEMIAARVPKNRYTLDIRSVARYLAMRDDMRLVERSVWMRVTA